MMCRGLTSFLKRLGELPAHLPPFGRQLGGVRQFGPCTTITGEKVREGENTNEGKPTPELCRWSRACLAPCGEGCAEDCAHVRHAALCVGKRQGCGEEAVRLVIGSRWRCMMLLVFSVGTNIQGIN